MDKYCEKCGKQKIEKVTRRIMDWSMGRKFINRWWSNKGQALLNGAIKSSIDSNSGYTAIYDERDGVGKVRVLLSDIFLEKLGRDRIFNKYFEIADEPDREYIEFEVFPSEQLLKRLNQEESREAELREDEEAATAKREHELKLRVAGRAEIRGGTIPFSSS